MKRTQIYIDEEQDRRLRERAASAGSTKSDLIRDAIDGYLDGGADASRLSRFKRAAHEAAGGAAGLPPGEEYVDAVRAADATRAQDLESRRQG